MSKSPPITSEQIKTSFQSSEILSPKTKVILCAIAIIAGLGLLIAGVCGHFQIGTLSTLDQVYAIALMATGSVLVIIGIILGGSRILSKDKTNDQVSDLNTNAHENQNQVSDLNNSAQENRNKVNVLNTNAHENQNQVSDLNNNAYKNLSDKAPETPVQINTETLANTQKRQESHKPIENITKGKEEPVADKDKAKVTSSLPDLVKLQLKSTDPVLQAINLNEFKTLSSEGGVFEIDMRFLEISLDFWVNREKDIRWDDSGYSVWRQLMSDPKRKLWVETINNRIDELDRAIHLKERLVKTNQNQALKIGHLLSDFPSGVLRFCLMTDDELARLKVSDIQKEQDRKPVWDVLCKRLHAIAKIKKPVMFKVTQGDIPNVLLTDLTKITAVSINSYPNLFPDITFLLMDLKEFGRIDFQKVKISEQTIKTLFEGPYAEREKSSAAQRLASCTPEAIYQLGPNLPKLVWGLLDPPLLSQLDFAKIFAGIKEEKDRRDIIGEIFKGPYPYDGREKSTAAQRLASCTPEAIYQLSPYLPKLVWKLLDPPLLMRLDFAKIFAGIKDEKDRSDIIGSIFEGPYDGREKSTAAQRLASCTPETIYQLSPYLPKLVWKLLDPPLLTRLDFAKIFAGIKDAKDRSDIIGSIFDGPYGDREKSTAAQRLASCTPEAIYQLSPYLPKLVWTLLDPPLLTRLDFAKIFAGIKDAKDRSDIIGSIFDGPYGDGKNSRAAQRLQSMEAGQVKIIKNYLPALLPPELTSNL